MTTPDVRFRRSDFAESDGMSTPRIATFIKYVTGFVELFAYIFTTNGCRTGDVAYFDVCVIDYARRDSA